MYRDIPTPAVIVDTAKVTHNITDMQERMNRAGVALRPHIKTHKLPQIAKMQLAAGASGITCATLFEAEVMAQNGIDDIFLAYPVLGKDAQRRAGVLNKTLGRFIVGLDNAEAARVLHNESIFCGRKFHIRVEIESGMRRTGVDIDHLVALWRELAALDGLVLDGIYTFKGLSVKGAPTADRESAAAEEAAFLRAARTRLQAVGYAVTDISGGSTPCGIEAAQTGELTEMRAGTYVFYDMMAVSLGIVPVSRCAAAVLATVISTPEPNRSVIDAGSKGISSDTALQAPPYRFEGHGHILGRDDLILARLSEEHGVITGRRGETGLKVGDRVRVIPNHICTTINLYESIWADDGKKPAQIRVAARGR